MSGQRATNAAAGALPIKTRSRAPAWAKPARFSAICGTDLRRNGIAGFLANYFPFER